MGGKALMVPNTAPGDVVEVSAISERRHYSLARIGAIRTASPVRRTPPCPYLPRCGGCDWQQIAYDAQVRLKGEIVARELSRALGITIESANLVEPAQSEFSYRSRVRVKIGPRGEIGFHELGSNDLVPIDRCMLADEMVLMPIALARALSRDLVEIESVAAGSGRVVLVGFLKKPPGAQQRDRAKRVLESDPRLKGIVLRAGDYREILGDAEIEIEIEPGVGLHAGADLFSQVNRVQNLKLVAEVMAVAAPKAGEKLLDLFCGVGNFTIPAARRGAAVTGVDSEVAAIAAAASNASRMELSHADFVAMKARELAAFLLQARCHPDAVILDPPRTGAADLIEPIAKLAPARVMYVSCDAATLARDLRALASFGYKLTRLRAFDFFPNTHHVEIAAHAVLT